MLSCCVNCREHTEGKDPKVARTKKWKNNAFNKICSANRFIKWFRNIDTFK